MKILVLTLMTICMFWVSQNSKMQSFSKVSLSMEITSEAGENGEDKNLELANISNKIFTCMGWIKSFLPINHSFKTGFFPAVLTSPPNV